MWVSLMSGTLILPIISVCIEGILTFCGTTHELMRPDVELMKTAIAFASSGDTPTTETSHCPSNGCRLQLQ